MASVQTITPCLWFDGRAEEAAQFYVSIFDDSEILSVTRFGKAGFEHHGRPEGSAMTVTYRIAGQQFTALNGGPNFRFTEAVSFVVRCDSQAEVDRFWAALADGGDPAAQACGWLKDRFGLSWQIVPAELYAMLESGEADRTERAMAALMDMKKIDLAALRRAYEGA
ncbi:VOC family protein [Microbaculum marinisediminis]|uniref:VOC family protein n=1 Tax=Microbaculum marinisediminis TaxID=2931392 RepID=A0AAW5QTG8_9HYPH|nr:VOC family protein [Microbaculum sp. A6E488]MCT8970507.1 VOC family protein [Microbaculum sp. A6E488]